MRLLLKARMWEQAAALASSNSWESAVAAEGFRGLRACRQRVRQSIHRDQFNSMLVRKSWLREEGKHLVDPLRKAMREVGIRAATPPSSLAANKTLRAAKRKQAHEKQLDYTAASHVPAYSWML